ncbi:uncharacterized protein [Aegilops tauschii subsp. strangulata]|uniref:uncharacterized protein n=1 Tax=Aegilops tauschii subsp. strangulata TaxID=200361 RepID=UPI003CC8903C
MSIICWNCRGLGSDSTVGELRWLVKLYRPSLLFLSETKMRDSRVKNFMWSLGFSGCYAISSEGLSGGLALFWTHAADVTVKAANKRCIDVQVKLDEGLVGWQRWLVVFELDLDEPQGVASSLRSWSKEAFGSVRKNIGKMERRLATIRASPPSPSSLAEEKHIEDQLCELFEREEVMERQRSRVDWLKAGDRNTEFFQARATARRRTNKIHSLLRDDGSVCSTQSQIKQLVQSYYEQLFTSKPRTSADELLQAIPSKVTNEMNADLCRPYTNEEIRAALFQMGPTKAPGPDGFPALFYQTHWEFLGDDICLAVRGFLEGRPIPEGFCDSVIVLIPKTTKPKLLKNFRPISLCSVLYKIASKVLANRLKTILHVVVSESQSAFVPGRLITDNTLIAYECLHSIRNQRVKKPFFALKIDMMKAYDRVEWSYLHQCLTKLGFANSWIETVMRCVTNVRYAVRVNGQAINKDKSALFFGRHCPTSVKDRVKAQLGISNESFKDSYLGMPTETQAIPTFISSCFRLHVAICEKFRKIVSDQWWGREDGKKKMHWRSWEWLSTPKSLGGMGFKDLALFNQAMLGKQGWRLLTDPESLCARVLKGRYFPFGDFWNASAPCSASVTWRAILHGRDLLKQGVQWGIGDGRSTLILKDHWIPSTPPAMLRTLSPIPNTATVHCLLDEENGGWNEESVHAFFPQVVADDILNINVNLEGGPDYDELVLVDAKWQWWGPEFRLAVGGQDVEEDLEHQGPEQNENLAVEVCSQLLAVRRTIAASSGPNEDELRVLWQSGRN